MNTIAYNYYLKIAPHVESVLLHSSYLLSDRTIATGSTRQQYNLFLEKREQFSSKLRMLENIFKPHEGFDDAKNAIKAYKDFKKIKHPPRQLIVAHKRLQKVLEAEYDNQTSIVLKTMDSLKLMQMAELQQYGYFDWFHITSEATGVLGEKHADPNEILQLLPGKLSHDNTLMLLPLTLFSDQAEFKDEFRYNKELPTALNNFSFLHTCFQLPNLLLLSFKELHTIKMQLSPASGPFHAAMDRWIQMSISNNAESSIQFFVNEVLPAANQFQAAMDENPILNQHKNVGNDKQQFQFALAQISVASVWQVLMDKAMIPWEEEWDALQKIATEPPFLNPRPVLLLTSFSQESLPQMNTDGASLKKSLDID